MKYIINEMVEYNPDDGILISQDDVSDMASLTRVSSELLLLFIKNNHVPLDREFILNELWGKKGLISSSNNLNNYVSMLRKALMKYGCSGVITTVPKYGFLFDAEIIIVSEPSEPSEPSESSESPFVTAVIEKKVVRSVFCDPSVRRFSFLYHLKCESVFIIIIFMLFLLWTVIYWHEGKEDEWERTKIYSLNQCRFYLIDDITRNLDKNNVVTTMKMIIENENLNCKRKANVYYFAENKVDASGGKVMNDLLVYCPYDSRIPCDNYYMERYEKNN